METVFIRVANWNSQRYARTYDHNLGCNLLDEEFYEWLTGATAVDKLDALCDIIYVAMGNIWKLDPSADVETVANQLAIDVTSFVIDICQEPAYFIGSYLIVNRQEPHNAISYNKVVIQLAIAQMLGMGLTYEQAVEAMLIVCDANDSKTVIQLDSTTKAGKGDTFVAPEPRLTELLAKVGLNA